MSLRKKATSLLLVIALLLTIVQPCLAELLVTSQNTEDVAFTLNLDAGWNLVSIPLIAENNSAESIFGQINTLDEVPVQIWNGEQFIPTETIEPLNGYFVYTESNLSIELQGSKIEGQTKQLKPGWNMIGGYRVDYPLDLSKIPNQVSQCPSLIFTDGQYVESHELTPGNGAWVFVDEDTLVDDGILRSMPEIEILSPLEDIYSNETIILFGHIKNSEANTAQIRHNGNSITVPIVGSNFSAELDLAEINTISIYIIENDIVYSKEILLDGDHLLDEDERQLGFDPLDPDSDCNVTEENEGRNGIVDGYEVFDGYLPVFAKVKIGADPFNNDTNDNGLTDYFELTKLGVVPGEPSQSVQAALMSTSGDGDDPYLVNSGAWDDPDGDGLSNLDEQNNGTDPLSADTDRDGLSDAEEIQHGTDPCDADADGDLLLDGFEIKIGTNPGVADNGTYHQIEESFADETLDLTLYGPAYSLNTVNVAEVNYSYLIDDTILVSKVYNIDSDENVQYEELKIKYDSTYVDNSTDISIYRFDENFGTFLKVESTIDASNEIVSCTGVNASKYAVLCSSKWDALFKDPSDSCAHQDSETEEEVSQPQILMPSEILIEGVDYGATFFNETPMWYLEALELEALEGSSGATTEGEVNNSLDVANSDSMTNTYYQVVYNGDFSKEQEAWAPSGPYELSDGTKGAEVNTYEDNYTSAPKSLKIHVWGEEDNIFLQCDVAHANVDLTNVNYLTFRYKCIESGGVEHVASSGLRFWIDSYGTCSTPNFKTPKTSAPASTDSEWKTTIIDVGGMTGQKNIYFRVYIALNGETQDRSTATYLIDDVTAWSSEPPCNPDTVNVRFYVIDSQNEIGVPDARVICNNEEKYTDSCGYTYDFFLTTKGGVGYQVQPIGYKYHNGSLRIEPDDFGTSLVEYVTVNEATAPTGSIDISSTPDKAEVYVDGNYYGVTSCLVQDLLAKEEKNSHNVSICKDGYNTVTQTIDVYKDQVTTVHFDLTAETGSLQVTSSPSGAKVYLNDTYQGTTSETTGVLTLPTVMVGNRTVKVVKNDYAPFTANVTIEKDQTTYLTATLNNDDLEEDGLLDYDEENGYRDGFGNVHTTDPSLIDTDGDGLSDGYEAGETVTENGKTFRKQRSDPTKADTDGDGLDDWDEDDIGTDPFNRDTDFDFIIDGVDDAPLTPIYISAPINVVIEKRDATVGSIFGETGIKGGSMNWIVGDDVASSPAYFIGWMTSGYFVAGDLRDALEALYEGDNVGAGLNALGVVPLAGDGERSINALKKVVTKYPSKAADLGRCLLKQDIVQRIPGESLQLFVLDRCFDNGATALRDLNVPMARILEVGKIDGVNLARHAEALGIIRGASREVDKEGTVAEIIAERTILNTLYPDSVYTFYSDVKLRNANTMILGEIDTVIVRDNNVVAIVQTKMGRNAAGHARDQLSRDLAVIDDRYRFISTDKPDLTPAKFRVVELDTVTIGPKDGNGFDQVIDYTNRELHEIYKTIKG